MEIVNGTEHLVSNSEEWDSQNSVWKEERDNKLKVGGILHKNMTIGKFK